VFLPRQHAASGRRPPNVFIRPQQKFGMYGGHGGGAGEVRRAVHGAERGRSEDSAGAALHAESSWGRQNHPCGIQSQSIADGSTQTARSDARLGGCVRATSSPVNHPVEQRARRAFAQVPNQQPALVPCGVARDARVGLWPRRAQKLTGGNSHARTATAARRTKRTVCHFLT
jgi:hypothetical protein